MNELIEKYDVIVVGAGHAGAEAAAAAANLGVRTLLITMDMTKIAQMSCNPAIGGIAKGQIVREIDALGGYTGIVTDRSTIQFRMLNLSKGPAMWSPRAQCDRFLFSVEWRNVLEKIDTLDLWQDCVTELIIEGEEVKGVKTQWGVLFYAPNVIITSGTFQNGIMHVGKNTTEGGRSSEPSSKGISEQLSAIGFTVGRMKTGTPCRIDGRTIDFSKLEEQEDQGLNKKFTFLNEEPKIKERKSCYVAYTNSDVHDILALGFDDSPLFSGIIKGIGPRYCPSIEQKIITFGDKESHHLFLEPEGINTNEYYLNGFSSSLPWDIQYNAIRKIKGLENVKIYRPGYAIEYDYYDPTQLQKTLETKRIRGLYFAGQVNGTTGYEEAAAQGLIAGINAALNINNKEEFVLERDQAYIGVLIDDLITKGVDEPYRMFTSRAEYRILLRQDNADKRLTELAHNIGLVDDNRYTIFKYKEKKISELIALVKSIKYKPEEINEYLHKKGTNKINQKASLHDILLRPQVTLTDLVNANQKLENFAKEINFCRDDVLEGAEIEIKYSGYIERERLIADKINRLNHVKLDRDLDYNAFSSLSIEARQKLNKIKPETIGQATRISGVSPSDINILLLFLGR